MRIKGNSQHPVFLTFLDKKLEHLYRSQFQDSERRSARLFIVSGIAINFFYILIDFISDDLSTVNMLRSVVIIPLLFAALSITTVKNSKYHKALQLASMAIMVLFMVTIFMMAYITDHHDHFLSNITILMLILIFTTSKTNFKMLLIPGMFFYLGFVIMEFNVLHLDDNVATRQSVFVLIVLSALIYIRRITEKSRRDLFLHKLDLEEKNKKIDALNAELKSKDEAINSAAFVSVFNKKGIIEFCNDQFLNENKIKPKSHPLLSTRNSHSTEIHEALLQNKLWKGEHLFSENGYSNRWLSSIITPFGKNEEKYLHIGFDITQTKELEKTLIKQKTELDGLNQFKNKLFSIIAHDLRAPLATLNGTVNLLKQSHLSKDEFRDLLQLLDKQLGTTRNMSDNLLKWAQSQMDGYEPNLQATEPNKIITETIEESIELANDKKLSIITHLKKDLLVTCDPELLRIIIRNTLSNAIKFSPFGNEISISTCVNDSFHLIIKDQGIGMSSERLDSIFSINKKSQPGTKKEKGIGIGMMLCKSLIEKQGGSIKIESEENKGTKVIFSLPLHKHMEKTVC